MALSKDPSVDSLSLEKLSIGIGKTPAPEITLDLNAPQKGYQTPKFQDYKRIGKFEINADQKYSGDEKAPNIPKIISPGEISKLRRTSLNVGYEKAMRIEDYVAYHELKQDFFLKWLTEMDYFRKVADGKYKKPDIICFGGRITDPLISPLITRFGEWEIYAAKYLDTVFIWDDKNTSNNPRSLASYYGFAYESLLTGKNPAKEIIDEFEKSFVIQEVRFGSHQLLVVSEIDAHDDQGKWIEIKTYKQCSPKGMQGKYLGYWAQSIVAGVEKLVIGKRDESGTLLETTEMTLDDALVKAGSNSIQINRCYQFENRLLTWIKKHFEENDPKIVKKFSWSGPPSSKIYCSEVPEKLPIGGMFPEWFVKKNNKKEVTGTGDN